ncbi:MAG: alpha/beta hydrolase [Pseudomonadota bacterium]
METAPFYDDVAYGPKGGKAHWLTASDGVRIRVAHWPKAQAKGTVLIFPGRTEYAEKYGDAAREFGKRGYASIAIDWRGQGLADRLLPERALGHVIEFADYQKDIAAVMAHVKALDLPEPYYLVAHSMGGCIGLRALHEGLNVKAVAFSAPMWGLALANWLKPIAWTLPALATKVGKGDELAPGQSLDTYVLREDFDLNTLTCDKEMWERLQEQATTYPDLMLAGPTMHWLSEATREMDALHEMFSPDYPTVTFLGTSEAVVDPVRVRNRMSRWSEGKLEVLKGAEHEVMLELPTTRKRVFDTAVAHFEAHA